MRQPQLPGKTFTELVCHDRDGTASKGNLLPTDLEFKRGHFPHCSNDPNSNEVINYLLDSFMKEIS